MSRSLSPRGAGTAIALLLLAGPSFAASPAPKPSASDVEAWSRLVDAAFPSDKLKGQALPTTYALTGLAALREGKPALGEACFRKAYAVAPEYEAEGGDLLPPRGHGGLQGSEAAGGARAVHPPLPRSGGGQGVEGDGLAGRGREVPARRAGRGEEPSPCARVTVDRVPERGGGGERKVGTRGDRAGQVPEDGRGSPRDGDRLRGVRARALLSLPGGEPADAIERKISPAYLAFFPRLDGWGAPYRVETSTDRKHYRIVSAGADGSFEVLAPLGAAARPAQRTVDDARGDIVFEDGKLVQEWSEKAFE